MTITCGLHTYPNQKVMDKLFARHVKKRGYSRISLYGDKAKFCLKGMSHDSLHMSRNFENVTPSSQRRMIAAIKQTTTQEQSAIKAMLVKIDFMNGDCLDYFRHLAQALAM